MELLPCRRVRLDLSFADHLAGIPVLPAQPAPLTPGEIHRFLVELWPVHHCFLPGHRIRVSVISSDFPWFASSLNQFGPIESQSVPRAATNSIHHGGEHASRIILPIQRGSLPR